jgi:hypothetical protein
MFKRKIQIPDRLFTEAKRLAQVICLRFEQRIRLRPPGRQPADQWRVPKGKRIGLPRVAEEHWTEWAHEDSCGS